MDMNLTTHELERRMRPGSLSGIGFLGPTESLEAVVAKDELTLESLGLSHEQIANALDKVLSYVLKEKTELLNSGQGEAYMKRAFPFPDIGVVPNLYDPGTIPDFSLANLPASDLGYRFEELQVFIAQYRGWQECPWGCDVEATWSSFDFLILNRTSGEHLTGPGLITHLIREHHFLEGVESSFRTDPYTTARVVGLLSEDETIQ